MVVDNGRLQMEIFGKHNTAWLLNVLFLSKYSNESSHLLSSKITQGATASLETLGPDNNRILTPSDEDTRGILRKEMNPTAPPPPVHRVARCKLT